jgi:hypothetical protein
VKSSRSLLPRDGLWIHTIPAQARPWFHLQGLILGRDSTAPRLLLRNRRLLLFRRVRAILLLFRTCALGRVSSITALIWVKRGVCSVCSGSFAGRGRCWIVWSVRSNLRLAKLFTPFKCYISRFCWPINEQKDIDSFSFWSKSTNYELIGSIMLPPYNQLYILVNVRERKEWLKEWLIIA